MEILDIARIAPTKTSIGREINISVDSSKVIMHIPPSHRWGGGKESKKIAVNRFVLLDDLFFEGLGLWMGEGKKDKGLYFGNSSPELLLRFLEFVEEKLGIARRKFKVTLNVPTITDCTKGIEKWSNTLGIPIENFTVPCVDPRINREYAQLYFNSIILAELMSKMCKTSEQTILAGGKFATAFLRGLFAAEGQVALKKWGVLFYVSFSSANEGFIMFIKRCLNSLNISSGKYMPQNRKFPIYGYKNFKRFKEFGVHTLHPEKGAKFERGFANYKRTNVLDGEEARALILQQLASGPKTYDDLAAALGKARTTIQAWHIPILDREGKVRRVGKRGQAWVWALAEGKSSAGSNI